MHLKLTIIALLIAVLSWVVWTKNATVSQPANEVPASSRATTAMHEAAMQFIALTTDAVQQEQLLWSF